jgi:hypothetical protein
MKTRRCRKQKKKSRKQKGGDYNSRKENFAATALWLLETVKEGEKHDLPIADPALRVYTIEVCETIFKDLFISLGIKNEETQEQYLNIFLDKMKETETTQISLSVLYFYIALFKEIIAKDTVIYRISSAFSTLGTVSSLLALAVSVLSGEEGAVTYGLRCTALACSVVSAATVSGINYSYGIGKISNNATRVRNTATYAGVIGQLKTVAGISNEMWMSEIVEKIPKAISEFYKELLDYNFE